MCLAMIYWPCHGSVILLMCVDCNAGDDNTYAQITGMILPFEAAFVVRAFSVLILVISSLSMRMLRSEDFSRRTPVY